VVGLVVGAVPDRLVALLVILWSCLLNTTKTTKNCGMKCMASLPCSPDVEVRVKNGK
jgi:hypothetical protein